MSMFDNCFTVNVNHNPGKALLEISNGIEVFDFKQKGKPLFHRDGSAVKHINIGHVLVTRKGVQQSRFRLKEELLPQIKKSSKATKDGRSINIELLYEAKYRINESNSKFFEASGNWSSSAPDIPTEAYVIFVGRYDLIKVCGDIIGDGYILQGRKMPKHIYFLRIKAMSGTIKASVGSKNKANTVHYELDYNLKNLNSRIIED